MQPGYRTTHPYAISRLLNCVIATHEVVTYIYKDEPRIGHLCHAPDDEYAFLPLDHSEEDIFSVDAVDHVSEYRFNTTIMRKPIKAVCTYQPAIPDYLLRSSWPDCMYP